MGRRRISRRLRIPKKKKKIAHTYDHRCDTLRCIGRGHIARRIHAKERVPPTLTSDTQTEKQKTLHRLSSPPPPPGPVSRCFFPLFSPHSFFPLSRTLATGTAAAFSLSSMTSAMVCCVSECQCARSLCGCCFSRCCFSSLRVTTAARMKVWDGPRRVQVQYKYWTTSQLSVSSLQHEKTRRGGKRQAILPSG